MSDIIGTPPSGWVPIEVMLYTDLPAGTYPGFIGLPNFAVIVTDADMYINGVLLPTEGGEFGYYNPTTDIFIPFYQHFDVTGSAHWEGFQKFQYGVTMGFRVTGTEANAGAVVSGYLVQDYTVGNPY